MLSKEFPWHFQWCFPSRKVTWLLLSCGGLEGQWDVTQGLQPQRKANSSRAESSPAPFGSPPQNKEFLGPNQEEAAPAGISPSLLPFPRAQPSWIDSTLGTVDILAFSITGFLSKWGEALFFKHICWARCFPLSSVNLISVEKEANLHFLFSQSKFNSTSSSGGSKSQGCTYLPSNQAVSSEPSKEREPSAGTGCGCTHDSCPFTATKK